MTSEELKNAKCGDLIRFNNGSEFGWKRLIATILGFSQSSNGTSLILFKIRGVEHSATPDEVELLK